MALPVSLHYKHPLYGHVLSRAAQLYRRSSLVELEARASAMETEASSIPTDILVPPEDFILFLKAGSEDDSQSQGGGGTDASPIAGFSGGKNDVRVDWPWPPSKISDVDGDPLLGSKEASHEAAGMKQLESLMGSQTSGGTSYSVSFLQAKSSADTVPPLPNIVSSSPADAPTSPSSSRVSLKPTASKQVCFH